MFKLCIDCKYWRVFAEAFCSHPEFAPADATSDIQEMVPCHFARWERSKCGPEARLFEDRSKPFWKSIFT